ncbi:patatin-like phospholipase family protein [Kosmotoga sp. DU53]|uniref:patatin-like phospholipase family protein n=1 Tax=Kosmotoga sp. DU53 TaxID=1310160 RepID=UPI0007C4BCC5|nr:patatin-like phospholipase family protein [Kosmotoga sp. DU53]OAA22181.1 hypothetical protein DU53_04890 [Kosmotoga sp. DU53]
MRKKGEKKSRKFLVLSGGGARGSAHVGVIRALEERGFVPDAIIGVSIGAVVGAGYAVLKDAELLWDYSVKIYKRAAKFFPFNFSSVSYGRNRLLVKISCSYMAKKSSVLPSKLYFRVFRKYLGKLHFEDLLIEFHCVSTDLKSGKTILHSSGKLFQALQASMAIPGIFPPVVLENSIMADGGTLNNLPADIARDLGADYVVAVDLSGKSYPITIPETSNALLNAMNLICENRILSFLRKEADFIIRPPVQDIDSLDFSRCLEIMEKSYEQTLNLTLPEEMFQ